MRDANQINRDSWDRYQADYILKIHEACDADVPPPLGNLPSDMVILAQRE